MPAADRRGTARSLTPVSEVLLIATECYLDEVSLPCLHPSAPGCARLAPQGLFLKTPIQASAAVLKILSAPGWWPGGHRSLRIHGNRVTISAKVFTWRFSREVGRQSSRNLFFPTFPFRGKSTHGRRRKSFQRPGKIFGKFSPGFRIVFSSLMGRTESHFYEFGPFRLDVTERLLLRDGQHVPLTPKAFEALLALVENGGHVIDKDE